MASYAHKIFLSYAKEDLALAEKLELDLRARGVSVYRDKTGLRAGTGWEEQLEKALKASQHLVVLWSRAAKERSTWVQHEISSFKAWRENETHQQIFPIYLDLMNEILQPIQGYDRILIEKIYPDGMGSEKGLEIWNDIVTDLADRVSGVSSVIPVVTVALTARIIENSETVIAPPPGVKMGPFLQKHGIASIEALHRLYGARPEDWKPFGGGGQTIRQVLDHALNDQVSGINARLARLPQRNGPRAVRWKWIDLMNSTWDDINTDVSRISTRPLILLIDPLSLCNPEVGERYRQFGPWVSSPDTIVAIIPPFESSEAGRYLQQWIRLKAAPLLDGYFDPPPPSELFPQYIVSANDDADVTRLVRTALYRHPQIVPPDEQRQRNVYTAWFGGVT